MKIIIVGLGQTGCALVRELSDAGYDVVVIDKDKGLIEEITDKYNVNGVVGSGAAAETLKKAGADVADALVALTNVDEINLLSCMQGKKMGVRRCAARLILPDLVEEADSLMQEYSIDYLVKPKSDIAEEIYRNIGMPGFVKIEGYFGNSVRMLEVQLLADSPLVGKNLISVRKMSDLKMLICTVLREGKLYVPDGSFVLQAGDEISVMADTDNMGAILEKLGVGRIRSKRIVIVGGGISAEYLIGNLLKDKKEITVLENNIDRCRTLMELFPTVNVVYSEEDVTEVLEEERVGRSDVVVSLTDHDETNLVISMYAWSKNIPSIITRVDRPLHVRLLHQVNMDITVSLTELAVFKMIRFIRNYEVGDAENEVTRFYYLADGKAEAMEFNVRGDFDRMNVRFADTGFRLKKDILIAGIIRDEKLIVPTGDSSIHEGDRVIIVAARKHKVRNLNDIFA
ncbi:MAG: Trk system potassium transporter TrkA [Lachnospiraceae bacterium]|nr:Trk system potassium transporter TrkA [Lachnospiraceae bacterium]